MDIGSNGEFYTLASLNMCGLADVSALVEVLEPVCVFPRGRQLIGRMKVYRYNPAESALLLYDLCVRNDSLW